MHRCIAILFLCIFLFSTSPILSQYCQNSIYVELLGSAGIYSINYDRMFTPYLGARVGFSYFSIDMEPILPNTTAYIFPISLNYFIGKGNSKLELGAGVTITSVNFEWFGEKGSGNVIIPNLNIGYRYQPRDGGLLFRIGFIPFFTSEGVKPWLELSLGAAF